ncbi:MAG TPA: hypothetical protein DCX55_09380, partial [Erythrobacter sp.]|nr:hypothetical protein [Erythrobacter sp.]
MSALQDMVGGMVAEGEASPTQRPQEYTGAPHYRGAAHEQPDHTDSSGMNGWLADKSVGEKLRAISAANIAVVLLCLFATCLGGFFALQARSERMAISAASVMAERMVADINEGRLFVQRYAVSGDGNDLVAAKAAFDQTDRNLGRVEARAAEVAPQVLPQIEQLDTRLAALRTRVVAAQNSRGTQGQWQEFSDSVYG